MEDSTSKFNINIVREVFLLGEETHVTIIKNLLKAYYFLHARAGSDVGAFRDAPHFVVAAADFTAPDRMQRAAAQLAAASPLAHKVIYVVQPNGISREQLLFAQEIGVRYVCAGPSRNDDLKDHLKRICVEAHLAGPLDVVREELAAAYKVHGRGPMLKVFEKLKTLAEGEDVLRLLVDVTQSLGDGKRTELYLKRLLALNPQNLWAANTLGRLYLRSGRGAEGIEMLAKLSQFHELDGSRLLALGQAQVVAGRTEEARANFAKGEALTGGADPRFKEGMAKVKLAEDDVAGALALLGDKGFSPDVIAFLNMRAVMAVRSDLFAAGVRYYESALKGVVGNKEVRAKLLFNKGLAHVRAGQLAEAQGCFKESVAAGARFDRAKGPLETVTAVLSRGGRIKKDEQEQMLDQGAEWEALY